MIIGNWRCHGDQYNRHGYWCGLKFLLETVIGIAHHWSQRGKNKCMGSEARQVTDVSPGWKTECVCLFNNDHKN